MGNESSKSTSDVGSSSAAVTSFHPVPDMDYCWATAFWTVQHESDPSSGMPKTLYKSNPTTSFAGENIVQRLTNRLKLYRHPNIIKYLGSYHKAGTSFLQTEYSYPLMTDPSNRSSVYGVSQGILDIIKALSFLHYTARTAHNNVCLSSIFYCPVDKRWKLGGLQWVERYQLINNKYLKSAKPHLEEKFIPPEDNTKFSNPLPTFHEARDVYGLGCVIEELLHLRQDEIPGQKEFLSYVRNEMKAQNPEHRPSLSEIAKHLFFQQDHIYVLDFIENLPLKSDREKTQFFNSLTERLFHIPEEIIGELLVPSLLSRMVMIDETSRTHFLPNLLKPESSNQGRRKGFDPNYDINSVLGTVIFKQKVCNVLLKIFHVHDYTIRMILLEHFQVYCMYFERSDLESLILPNLLQGLKDSHEDLVSGTLLALAELVPILGATRVVGQPRVHLFKEGLPSKRYEKITESAAQEKGHCEAGLCQKRAPTTSRPCPIGAEEQTTDSLQSHSNDFAKVPSDAEQNGWGEWDENEEQGQEEELEQERTQEMRNGVAKQISCSTTPQLTPFVLPGEANPLAEMFQEALKGMQLHVYQLKPQNEMKAAPIVKKDLEKQEDLFADMGMQPEISKTVTHEKPAQTFAPDKPREPSPQASRLAAAAISEDVPAGEGWADEFDDAIELED